MDGWSRVRDVGTEVLGVPNPEVPMSSVLPPATILVVDDIDLVRRLVTRTLTLAGYSVIEAGDGLEALQTIRRLHGAIDLVLSDILMPKMNGTELAGLVLEEFPESRIVLMSAYLPEGLATVGPEDRQVRLMQKPVGHAELLRVVAVALADDRPIVV
jgi:two-component system cell cycle sensor histidine kinase/response regulator CckA